MIEKSEPSETAPNIDLPTPPEGATFRPTRRALLSGTAALAVTGTAVHAQLRGSPGAPNAVEFPNSRVLPTPTPQFSGTIMPTAKDSVAAWPPAVAAPEGAPNVLLILTDDVGFGAPSTFGGLIPTPALDKIAAAGLRYTAFHTTALCSPTRAAMLTGRNHHSAGTGNISEMSSGFPGYNSIIPPEKATVAQTLRLNGYSTAWFGKNHNIPAWEVNPVGPFGNWPVGMGFDYFFGFVGGDTSQWQPGNLFRNTTPIHPYVGRKDWNLGTAMADDAISHIRTLAAVTPNRPWFIHYAPGGTHAPHQPPKDWIETFKGKFDAGWETLARQIFDNQKTLGVIPANAQLPPWPDFLKRWDSLTIDEKRLFTRQVEVYAAYLAYTDHEIGRVIQAVEDLGQFDNTLIIYISGDNGSSAEGSMNGTPNEVAYFNLQSFTVEQQLPLIEAWGSDRTYNHMAVPWTFAFNTPYRWTKQVASHFGGTRNGMAISWPKRIADTGGIRMQFHHVIDIVPTLLEAIGIPHPTMVNGIAQAPVEGTSVVYTWDKPNADAPSHRKTQYFEIFGNRAIYHDGWVACTTPIATPWNPGAPVPDDAINGYNWELYNLAQDPTELNDLAKQEPERLRVMQELWLVEATRYQVLPVNNSVITGMITPRPGPAAGRKQFIYTAPVFGIQANSAPNILNRSYRISADIEVPQGGANGMLITQGGRFAGWGLYLREGKPVFTMNLLGMERPKWEAAVALLPGRHTLVFDWQMDANGGPFSRGGSGTLSVDGQEVARRSLPRTLPFTFAWDETLDVGLDTGTPVDDSDYQVPFNFTGKLNRIIVDLGESSVTPEALRDFQSQAQKRG
ncbi:arylsulfatase [Methylobacterium fujisawaense]|uniref:arylsulfatase n=1 Tax=Methylobacterium fujisawaense TaxID=107400 RepID=UPI0031F51BDA